LPACRQTGFFLPPAQKKKEAPHTNSTFGFLPTRMQTQKKPKELFLSQRQVQNLFEIEK